MLIASYNKAAMGDVLVLLTAPSAKDDLREVKGHVTRVTHANGELVGFNILNVSAQVALDATVAGQVALSVEQVAAVNAVIRAAGFDDILAADDAPKLVVGYVETAEPHPDSDHLQVTTTKVSDTETVQIVSGSPNMRAGIKVVVAKVGAMMPSGLIIWPSALRGVPSNGMIVSGRELQLPNAPQVPGALILPDDYAEIGTPFDRFAESAQKLFID